MDVPQITFDALVAEIQKIDTWHEPWQPWFHENHLSLVVGHGLLNGGASYVLPEVKPPEYQRGRCDLFARCGADNWFIEFKKGWHGVGKGWNSKPSEQLRNWLKDVVKLLRVKNAEKRRVFSMIHFRQEGRKTKEPILDTASIDATAASIVQQLLAGREANQIKFSSSRMNPWETLANLEAALKLLGRFLMTPKPILGKDHEKPGEFMEHRVIVCCF